jgi:hypothetical protein
MSKNLLVAVATVLGVACAGAATAQDRRNASAEPPPEAFGRVVQCRSIAAADERLACFDREVAAMEAARASGQLVAIDRQQVRRTRSSLFGLSLPNLHIFSDDSDDEARSVETTIRSARQGPDGRWVIQLADGARWVQTDDHQFAIYPRAGQPIRIRRGAMGSYLANVNNQSAIRVRRVN